MAAISTTGSGNWSSTTPNAPWPSGVLPTSADTVTIASGHTIMLDTTGLLCNTLAINGSLLASATANSDLTVGNAVGDTSNIALNNGGTMSLDMSASAGYTCTLYLNKGANTNGLGIQTSGTSTLVLKGAPRKRWTRLNGAIVSGATSATVDDATGWRVGDRIIFGTTQAYNAIPRIDIVTLTSIAGNAIGWTGGISYDHADNGYVGNFSSNLIIRPYSTNKTYVAADNNGTRTVQDVLFDGFAGSVFAKQGLSMNFGNATATVNNNAFFSTHASSLVLVFLRFLNAPVIRQDNIFYCSAGNVFDGQSSDVKTGDWERAIVFRSGGIGLQAFQVDERFIDSVCMASSIGSYPVEYGASYDNSSILACNNSFTSVSGNRAYAKFSGCDFGVEFGAANATLFSYSGNARVIAEDCQFQTSGTLLGSLVSATKTDFAGLDIINKNSDVSMQEAYYPFCEIKRDNSTINRSASSISIKPVIASTDSSRQTKIPIADGETVRIVGYVRRDNSSVTATVSLTGTVAGVTLTPPTPFSSSAVDTWQQFDLSITNTAGADGSVVLTYLANSTNTTSTAYFDGVPDAPFITRARHYGFVFDESNPKRVVDPYTVASEATAAAYTGVTINNSTKKISFGAGTADTSQKFYDYSRAWCVADLTRQIPFTRSGSLFSLTSGWTVVDPAYTTTLTWSGGTVQFTSTGEKAVNIDAAIVEFNVATGGTFTMTGTLTGTLDLRNLDDTAITVEVPTGTGYTTANNTGGAITVTTPQIYQSVTVSGATAGSRIQIYDTAASAELYNGTPTFPYTWTDGVAASANRTIRLRIMSTDTTPGNAEIMIDKVIGTCGTTAGTAALSYLHAPEPDDVYNGNGFDGSAVTGMTIDDAALRLSVTAGTIVDYSGTDVLVIDGRKIYAYETYWLGTEAGIRDESRFIRAMDAVNFRFVDFKIINETATPVYPVLINNAYLVDDATGVSATLVDYAGGPVHFAPDHMISNIVTVGGANVITGDIADIPNYVPSASSVATAVWNKTLP